MNKLVETDFMELKSLREKNLERVDVLNRVGTLALMPGTEFATTQQVADFYQVTKQAINSLVFDNKEELTENGLKHLTGKDLVMSCEDKSIIKSKKGYTLIGDVKVAHSLNIVFPKRAILLVGMLLRDSEVSKQLRTYLLDVEQFAEEIAPEVINAAVGIMDNERELKADLADAILNGDILSTAEIMGRIKAFNEDISSRRIIELTAEKEILIADNANLMAQFEECNEDRVLLDKKVKFLCQRTKNMAERKALCASIIEAYGLKEFNSEKLGYDSIYDSLLKQFSINVYARRPFNSNKPFISYFNIAELTLLEVLLRKVAITFDLKEFYLD